MTEIARRLIHLHVPKTAGTALRTAFQRRFQGSLRIFPEWNETKFEGINPEDYDFFSGHIGFETAARLNGDIVTVLRHPVDRFISVYHFWRQLHDTGVERSINTELATKYSLDDFVTIKDQSGIVEEFQNRCTFQIAFGSSISQRKALRVQGLNDDAIFKMAVENLKQIRVVGIQEKLGQFAEKISDTFGVDLELKKVNVTLNRPEVTDVSVSTLRNIHDWLYMDIELYQEALRLS
jgi:hypothetical protein